jgi:hypothetical protein
MQRALCNATAFAEKHTHICKLDRGHKERSHACRCGAAFIAGKKMPESGAELKKRAGVLVRTP